MAHDCLALGVQKRRKCEDRVRRWRDGSLQQARPGLLEATDARKEPTVVHWLIS